MLRSQVHNEQIMDMRKQRLLLKAQKEERKKKAGGKSCRGIRNQLNED